MTLFSGSDNLSNAEKLQIDLSHAEARFRNISNEAEVSKKSFWRFFRRKTTASEDTRNALAQFEKMKNQVENTVNHPSHPARSGQLGPSLQKRIEGVITAFNEAHANLHQLTNSQRNKLEVELQLTVAEFLRIHNDADIVTEIQKDAIKTLTDEINVKINELTDKDTKKIYLDRLNTCNNMQNTHIKLNDLSSLNRALSVAIVNENYAAKKIQEEKKQSELKNPIIMQIKDDIGEIKSYLNENFRNIGFTEREEIEKLILGDLNKNELQELDLDALKKISQKLEEAKEEKNIDPIVQNYLRGKLEELKLAGLHKEINKLLKEKVIEQNKQEFGVKLDSNDIQQIKKELMEDAQRDFGFDIERVDINKLSAKDCTQAMQNLTGGGKYSEFGLHDLLNEKIQNAVKNKSK